MAIGHVVALNCNTNGNIMGRAHTNPILDTRTYQVEFAGGKVTVLNAHVIAESMFTQCNANGKEYLLLDVLVDYCKDNKVVSLTE